MLHLLEFILNATSTLVDALFKLSSAGIKMDFSFSVTKERGNKRVDGGEKQF